MAKVHLVVNVKTWHHASCILCLDLHAYKFKSKMNYVLLQNIPQLLCAAVANVLISEYLWNHELEHEEKQGNGHLALLGDNTLLCKKRLHFMLSERKYLTN